MRLTTFQYTAPDYEQTGAPGAIRTTNVNGITNTWAIARPVSYPRTPYAPPASVARGSGVGFSPAEPRVEMDPSNQQTWQRPYRFTN